ncbi:dynein assembly factor 3, axonemal-like [Actinia tenebrosa]|uniref:Dynein assembly factor 3, axonemal-like n=1 Tax=Actinia tenebrosa TaxID=6105 RepID=A0A6P8HSW7_ACTTE|nr:dynein assembly factor 3, axonemal-like [Actinia tenebrosa]
MVDAFGAITWWGCSPALDLQHEFLNLTSKFRKLEVKHGEDEKEPDQFNILLIGAGDCRHILKTLAYAKRYPRKMINVYVVENNIELLARHLLLLSIALEPKEKLGLQEKTELFLELFGNSHIRPQTSEYLQNISAEFIRMVTDLDYLEACLPCFNLSHLKFFDRDVLEGIFKFWRNTDAKLLDMQKAWETRVREYLAARFDYRANVFDWDFVMKLQKMASVVNEHEYKNWREQGVAFKLREDSTYEVSNRCLSSELVFKKSQGPIAIRGYWGDIVNSPYISFGIQSEEQRLFKVNNGQHIKTATDVAEFNITAMMHELMTGKKYSLPNDEDKKPKVLEEATFKEIIEEEEEEKGEEEGHGECQGVKTQENKEQNIDNKDYLKIDRFKIHFQTCNLLSDFHKRPKFSRKFHCVYFSNRRVHCLIPEVKNVFADRAVLFIESTKFMLDLDPKLKKEYMDKAIGMARAAGCEPTREFDGLQDAHAIFTFDMRNQPSS